jgi:DNA-directed RNA polymerase specialized sigma24 family protein
MGARDVLDGIAALPEEQRSVLLLVAVEDMSYAPAAAHAFEVAVAQDREQPRPQVAIAALRPSADRLDPEAAMGARDVLDGIAALPEEQRSVLLLVAVEDREQPRPQVAIAALRPSADRPFQRVLNEVVGRLAE